MDQTRDLNGRQLYRLTRLYSPPGFVKEASATDLCGDDQLPPHVYGDPRHKIFPCHTPAATWTSAAFFLDKQAEFKDDAPLIWGRILHCAKVHGCDRELEELRQKVASVTVGDDADLSDEDFALVFTSPDGSRERHYPLRNGLEVKKAAEHLLQWRDKFPYEVRREFADKVLQKAAQYGADIGEHGDDLEKIAGHGACTAKEAAEMLLGRFHAARHGPGPHTPVQKELLKLADMLARHPSRIREPGVRVKLASVVDSYDRATGLLGQYGNILPRPEDVLFGLTREKMASAAAEHCSTVTGNIYRLADLERAKLAAVKEVLGDDFAKELTSDGLHVDSEKAAALLPTLPRNDMELLAGVLEGMGIRPILKEASASTVGISREYLRKMAAERQAAWTRDNR